MKLIIYTLSYFENTKFHRNIKDHMKKNKNHTNKEQMHKSQI